MKKYVFITFLCCGLITSTQLFGQENSFLKRFQTFVESVEKQDSISSQDWNKLSTQYKDFRTEYKTSYKDKFDKDEYKQYNELKGRYLKQVTIKKLGGNMQKGLESTSGIIKGFFKKTDKKKD